MRSVINTSGRCDCFTFSNIKIIINVSPPLILTINMSK